MQQSINKKSFNFTIKPPQKEKSQKDVIAEVTGKVIYINPKNRTLFKIHAAQSGKDFRCKYEEFLPLAEGDAIYGMCKVADDGRWGQTLFFLEPPFVILGTDKDTILKSFLAALRRTGFGPGKSHQLYEALELKCGKKTTNITTALDKIASHWSWKRCPCTEIFTPYLSVINEKQGIKLAEWWYKHRVLRRLHLLGIYNKEVRDSKMDPNDMWTKCLQNPYVITCLDMDKCKNIMYRLGQQPSKPQLICGQIARYVKDIMSNRGWVGVPLSTLYKSFPDVSRYKEQLENEYGVEIDMDTAYLPYAYEVEIGINDLISNHLHSRPLPQEITGDSVQFTRDDLSPEQESAVRAALLQNITIITGGGGCGKTTAIKEIVHNLELNHIRYRVVSFTGKAVAKIREVIGKKDPMTMHMMISNKKEQKFQHLIVDEASMVTSPLFWEFVKKFGRDYRITLVGDVNQLTPIGWGSFFANLISSGVVPVNRLVHCHRIKDDGSYDDNGILVNSKAIVRCSKPGYGGPLFEFEQTNNFKIIPGDVTVIGDLVRAMNNCGMDSDKIMIVSPFNKYLKPLNEMCKEIYNTGFRSIKDFRGTEWTVNDRVMMTENNYGLNIMNGDEGRVIDISNTEIKVQFKDGNEHLFLTTEVDKDDDNNSNKCKIVDTSCLVHAFAVSVHRSQGSEWDYVIVYIPKSDNTNFLNSNLMYTAITRAKQLVWLVGDHTTMVKASVSRAARRHDNLALRLKESQIIDLE